MKKFITLAAFGLFFSGCTVYRFRTPVAKKESLIIYVSYETNTKGAVVKNDNPATSLLLPDSTASDQKKAALELVRAALETIEKGQ